MSCLLGFVQTPNAETKCAREFYEQVSFVFTLDRVDFGHLIRLRVKTVKLENAAMFAYIKLPR